MNLFELFVKIGAKDEASGTISKITSGLGKGLATAAKIGTAAVSAAAAGITALTTAAVNNFAEYEQLVGGAELMFGDAFHSVMNNAQEAYKTVQMSQNEYLQQVNGFATGLKTALGGNEQAAADLAHRIIQAEADVVAATGNSQEAVQNAFNGIMKSNFTMLDNLQIGITPTKEGFQEVIDKVNDWNKANGNATKYQMGNLADMQSALVDYIDMVGMSGYAQAEASGTITGSISSMKAAWSDFLTSLADENADYQWQLDNLLESVKTVAQNVFPVVEQVLWSITDMVEDVLPEIAAKIPEIISEVLPRVTEIAVKLVESLINGISQNQEMLFTSIFDVVTYLADSFIGMLPEIVKLGLDLIVSLANGIAESLPELIPTIMDVIMQIVNILTDPANLTNLLNAALTIITELAYGLMDAIPQLVQAVSDIIINIADFLVDPVNLANILKAAVDVVIALAVGLVDAIPVLLKHLPKLWSSIIDNFKNVDWGSLGKNLVDGFKNGISKAWYSLKTWFKNLFGDLIGIAKKILGIASPSKVFKKIGGFTAEGFGAGFEDEFAHVKDDMEDALNFDDASVGINASIRKVGAGVAGGAFGGTSIGNININIDGAKYSDEQSLASAIALEIQNMTDRRAAVYA